MKKLLTLFLLFGTLLSYSTTEYPTMDPRDSISVVGRWHWVKECQTNYYLGVENCIEENVRGYDLMEFVDNDIMVEGMIEGYLIDRVASYYISQDMLIITPNFIDFEVYKIIEISDKYLVIRNMGYNFPTTYHYRKS